MNKKLLSIIFIFATTLSPLQASYADGITIVFKSGTVIYLADGYKQILDKVKANSSSEGAVEVSISGETIVLTPSDIAMLCKGSCQGMRILGKKEK